MVPAGYVTQVPSDYSDLPQLQGRAVVEMVVRKPDGEVFDVEGVNFKEAKMKMVIDGYSSPVTGGNFIFLVHNQVRKNNDKPGYGPGHSSIVPMIGGEEDGPVHDENWISYHIWKP
jgi:hypothetical protein